MADANAIAAAVTTALAAHTSNHDTGPRDPKYSELDIEPETRSPDLLDRSSFRTATAATTLTNTWKGSALKNNK